MNINKLIHTLSNVFSIFYDNKYKRIILLLIFSSFFMLQYTVFAEEYNHHSPLHATKNTNKNKTLASTTTDQNGIRIMPPTIYAQSFSEISDEDFDLLYAAIKQHYQLFESTVSEVIIDGYRIIELRIAIPVDGSKIIHAMIFTKLNGKLATVSFTTAEDTADQDFSDKRASLKKMFN
ncbi:hypothetical protein LPW36_02360 [Jinshanibacter sp. LJY008]|uniref:Uncharacterized protein n=1 Tax=Limnobaculum eriocheiris TaxID=2897391 RepID=A0A9X1SNF0_9GAMM|nr:hypothetical protein [Limnobaculum eriocheiris]MCD1124882.1 hypothetical protein [Limnobaculum eriocheiris]